MLNGEMMMVVWHVDGLKVSHKYQFEINNFNTYFSDMYVKNVALHRGKAHNYLGI